MKRIIFLMLLCISAISCGETTMEKKESKYKSEGWVDDNTFRVNATGFPKANLTKKSQRQNSAKKAALINAQKKLINKFTNIRVKTATDPSDMQSTGVVTSRKYNRFVKSGKILEEIYDTDDSCKIWYQVEKKGLKNEITGKKN